MQTDSGKVSLDPISRQILLLLSSGQRLTLQEIARAINQLEDFAAGGINVLELRNFIRDDDGRYHLSPDGFVFLAEMGIRPSKPIPPPETKNKSSIILEPPLFGSWRDLALWSISPMLSILILIPTIMFAISIDATKLGIIISVLVLLLSISLSIYFWNRINRSIPIIVSLLVLIGTIFLVKNSETIYLKFMLVGTFGSLMF